MTTEKLFTQIGDEVREFTPEEYAQRDLDNADAKRIADEMQAKEAKEAAAKTAILAKIGITEAELKIALS